MDRGKENPFLGACFRNVGKESPKAVFSKSLYDPSMFLTLFGIL